MTVYLGVAVALLWGSADTAAVFATKKVGTSTTTFVAQLAGFFLVSLVGLAFVGPLGLMDTSAQSFVLSILFGVVLGGFSAAAYLTLYKSLHHGPLAVVSPVVSAQGGVTMLLAVVLLQEHLDHFQTLFLLVTFVGVLLASLNGKQLAHMKPKSFLSPGVLYALIALLSFGVLSFGLGIAARSTNWFICVFWIRFFSFLFLAVILREKDAFQARRTGRFWGYVLSIGVGCGDVGGLALLSLATVSGSIGVVGMISSTYSVIPLAVGVFFLKERLVQSQLLGCMLLVVGLAGIAAPGQYLVLPLAVFALTLFMSYVLVFFYQKWHVSRRLTSLGGMRER